MKLGKATGLQITFAIVAAFLLAAPLSIYLGRQLHLSKEWFDSLARIMQLSFLALIIFAAERIKPGVIGRLLGPIPRSLRWETGVVSAAQVVMPFAALGALMLWYWTTEGANSIEQRFAADVYHTAGESRAFSASGLVHLFLGVAIAPLVEEIAFRGLLYRAWEEKWGWVPAMLASSAVFGLLHSGFLIPFCGGILFTCLYRRTGTLVAPIIAHAVGNAFVWYPLLGQHYIPEPSLALGDLTSWWLHFMFMVAFFLLGPLYLFMCREACVTRDDEQPVPA